MAIVTLKGSKIVKLPESNRSEACLKKNHILTNELSFLHKAPCILSYFKHSYLLSTSVSKLITSLCFPFLHIYGFVGRN